LQKTAIWLALASTFLIVSPIAAATDDETNKTETKTQSTDGSINIANLRVFDVNGIQRIFYLQGQQLELATTIESRTWYGGHIVIITEVRDKNDVTVMLGTQSAVVLGSAQTVRIPWAPDIDGEFKVRSFALQSLDHPTILSSPAVKTVDVDKIRDQEHYINNEAAISIGVADEKVKQLFNGQEMVLSYVRAFGVGFPGCQGACGIMHLHNGNNSEGLDLGIDLTKERVISIKAAPKLVSQDAAAVFRFVETDPARAGIEFRQPIPLEDFVSIVSQQDITVHSVGYLSNKKSAGHGSVWEPFNADTLKAKLESEGEELVGISSFFGLATGQHWLDFLRLNAESASLDWLEIRGSNFVECLAYEEKGKVVC
jgi:hypothetical protein